MGDTNLYGLISQAPEISCRREGGSRFTEEEMQLVHGNVETTPPRTRRSRRERSPTMPGVASPHLRRVQQPRERSRAAHACARAQGAEAGPSGLSRCGCDALVLGLHAAHAGWVQERSDVP